MRDTAIVLDIEQGTPEWLATRVGVFTASEFDRLITPAKLQPSTHWRGLILKMAAEVVMGHPVETEQTSWMGWGLMYEDEARKYYEMETGVRVARPGFVFMDESRRVGCSPDGLTQDGGLEIKCPKPETHIQYLLDGVLPQPYICQVQGCMYVTGLPYWDFLSYHPDMPAFLTRIYPDAAFQEALAAVLPQAIAELDEVIARAREKGTR